MTLKLSFSPVYRLDEMAFQLVARNPLRIKSCGRVNQQSCGWWKKLIDARKATKRFLI